MLVRTLTLIILFVNAQEALSQVDAPSEKILAAQAHTPVEVVEAALSLASLTPKDTLFDMGSGDGRVVFAAARRGAHATGFDIDKKLIEDARRNAASLHLEHLADFEVKDFLDADVSSATVIFAYLSRSGMEKIRQQIVPKLRSGTRLVSVTFDLPGWMPTKTELVKDAKGVRYVIYLWTIK
jgi:precorrin-6B methylase 2